MGQLVESMKAMRPTADENYLTEPWTKGVEEARDSGELIHALPL
jgi:hypothetical protein